MRRTLRTESSGIQDTNNIINGQYMILICVRRVKTTKNNTCIHLVNTFLACLLIVDSNKIKYMCNKKTVVSVKREII